jgi:hypothetical protein
MAALLVAGASYLRRPIQENYTTSDRSQGFHYQFGSPAEAAQFVARVSAWILKRGYTTAPDDLQEIVGSSPNTYLIVARKSVDPSTPGYFYLKLRRKPAEPNQIDVTLGEKHYAPESVHKRLLAEGSHEFDQFKNAFPQATR